MVMNMSLWNGYLNWRFLPFSREKWLSHGHVPSQGPTLCSLGWRDDAQADDPGSVLSGVSFERGIFMGLLRILWWFHVDFMWISCEFITGWNEIYGIEATHGDLVGCNGALTIESVGIDGIQWDLYVIYTALWNLLKLEVVAGLTCWHLFTHLSAFEVYHRTNYGLPSGYVKIAIEHGHSGFSH